MKKNCILNSYTHTITIVFLLVQSCRIYIEYKHNINYDVVIK